MTTMSIPLTQGKRAYFDAVDWELLSSHTWYAAKHRRTYYAQTMVRDAEGRRQILPMHRLLLGLTTRDEQADHKNHNGLDNRRCNLRPATSRQNVRHLRAIPGKSSPFKGVSWNKARRKWRVFIMVDGLSHNLGAFDNEQEAAKAYDAAASLHFGDYAHLNNVGTGVQ